ncbi:MAG: hypothetical protein GAK29_01441 [Acinetobacter bereziniae]|uniref:Uncharacterized protein n=1 Tax=Acinetobacter bereziniae TaxID=106648 RepID=A0A833PH95_ACIBZ|nr:MAG: hypothetical protein GAK29_01441 [Acinetobacter bereziniae]
MIKISNCIVDESENHIVKDIQYDSNSKITFTLFDGRIFLKNDVSMNDVNFALNSPDVVYKNWFEGGEMKSFDDANYSQRDCEVHNHAYYLGQQSKQAEIDSINRDLNHAFATVELQVAEIDRLRKRIDFLKQIIDYGLGEDDFKS